MILHASLSEDVVEMLAKSSLRGPCLILYNLCKKSLHKDLADAMYYRGACMKTLVGGCRELSPVSCIKIL